MISVLALMACNNASDVPLIPFEPSGELPADPKTLGLPPTCDAGTDVWVQRVFPMLLGRRVHGAAETQMWAAFADEHGRDSAVRALAGSPEYLQWWKIQLADLVYAARVGLGEDSTCFEKPMQNQHDGSLTQFLRSNSPDAAQYDGNFNMADVIFDGLIADDVSTTYQANIFAKTNYTTTCAMFDEKQVENQVRMYQGDQLLETYTDRSLSCMGCHNSEFSVTDNPDPALDRSWGVSARFEEALFGTSTGPADPMEYYAMHRGYGVVFNFAYFGGGGNYNMRPWGMDQSCGQFERTPPNYDFLNHDSSFFGGDHGTSGSLWDIERMFAGGVDDLAVGSLEIAADQSVDASQAFAYLTGQHFVDQTWKLAFGTRLLLPYGLSRNQHQQERLQNLTERFLANGWSLTELLVDIAADPYFNTGLPETCRVDPYGMEPVVDPYTTEYEGALAKNGPGDLVHRHTARTLLRTLYHALDFGEPREYFGINSAFGNPDEVEMLQRALGVFHSDASPGFNGVDFQGMLAWEDQLHGCDNPGGSSLGFLRELHSTALSTNATVEEMTLSLKDRLTADGTFQDDEERALVEALMGVPLSTKVSDVEDTVIGRKLGLFCGVLTESPEFVLRYEPRASGPVPALSFDVESDCATLTSLAAAIGVPASCGD